MTEEWRAIPGYPGYEASASGNVRRGALVLKPSGSRDGRRYLHVGAVDSGGTRRTLLVHRAVLLAFVGPCPEGMVACHNNGLPRDNRAENLRWDTQAGNLADRARHGTELRGTRVGSSKLTEAQVVDLRARVARGDKLLEVANDLGVTKSLVSQIALRKWWRHVS